MISRVNMGKRVSLVILGAQVVGQGELETEPSGLDMDSDAWQF